MSYNPEYHKRYRELNQERIRNEYIANREVVKERSRCWGANNRDRKLAVGAIYREHMREQRNAYMRERYRQDPNRHISAMSAWRKANPERYRDQYLRAEFGISLAEYNALFEDQGGVCAICKTSTEKVLVVDHNHQTGVVRGLLCSGCNAGLGQFKDNPERMIRAAHYINQERTSQ